MTKYKCEKTITAKFFFIFRRDLYDSNKYVDFWHLIKASANKIYYTIVKQRAKNNLDISSVGSVPVILLMLGL